jgi:peroxiredoxin
MSIINSQIKPFKATAFLNGKFIPVSDADLKGKWSIVFFYPADFTFVCPTELGDLADVYLSSRNWASSATQCPPTRTSRTRHGTTPRTPSRKSPTR